MFNIYTCSWQWSNGDIFDVTHNQVAIVEDNASVVSRTRLLILSDPTSMYNDPDFGVGLRRHLWQYNNENQKAIIRDRIVNQLRLNEPSVIADETEFSDGLLFTGGSSNEISSQEYNKLKMTVGLHTKYNESLNLNLDEYDRY